MARRKARGVKNTFSSFCHAVFSLDCYPKVLATFRAALPMSIKPVRTILPWRLPTQVVLISGKLILKPILTAAFLIAMTEYPTKATKGRLMVLRATVHRGREEWSRGWRWLFTVCSGNPRDGFLFIFSYFSIWDPVQWNDATHIQSGSSIR